MHSLLPGSLSPASGWSFAERSSSLLQLVVFARVEVTWLMVHSSSGIPRALVLMEMKQPSRLTGECFWERLPLELHGGKDVAFPGHCLGCQGQQFSFRCPCCRPKLRGQNCSA